MEKFLTKHIERIGPRSLWLILGSYCGALTVLGVIQGVPPMEVSFPILDLPLGNAWIQQASTYLTGLPAWFAGAVATSMFIIAWITGSDSGNHLAEEGDEAKAPRVGTTTNLVLALVLSQIAGPASQVTLGGVAPLYIALGGVALLYVVAGVRTYTASRYERHPSIPRRASDWPQAAGGMTMALLGDLVAALLYPCALLLVLGARGTRDGSGAGSSSGAQTDERAEPEE